MAGVCHAVRVLLWAALVALWGVVISGRCLVLSQGVKRSAGRSGGLWDVWHSGTLSGCQAVLCRSVRLVVLFGALGLSAGVSGLVAGACGSGGRCEGVTLSSGLTTGGTV